MQELQIHSAMISDEQPVNQEWLHHTIDHSLAIGPSSARPVSDRGV